MKLYKADLHVHSEYSKIEGGALKRITHSESYTPPEEVYRIAKKRGMDFITITDHNSIQGALKISHFDDVFISEEVTTKFPEDGCEIHLITLNINEKLPDLSKIPFPRWDILKKDKYIVDKVLHLTRGCPYNCSFCSVTQLFGRRIRSRPVEKVVDFIKAHKGKGLKERLFVFLDDNIMGNKKYAKQLFKALIPLKIIWMSQASVNAAYDEELLKLAGESGCKALFVGFESISKGALKEVGKSQNKVDFYKEAIKRFHKYGIFLHGAFIFGMDDHDENIFKRTVDFILKTKLDSAQFSILTPLPGTRFHQEVEAEGRIIDRDWSNYDCGHVVFKPKKMSPAQLDAGMAWAYVKTFSLPSIFKRLSGVFSGGRWKYTLLLFAFNLYYRKTCSKMKERILRPMVQDEMRMQESPLF